MKRIITVQDISCVGKCSLTVALPILSAMEVETAVLPTAVLSAHTKFQDVFVQDLTDQITPITDHWKKENITFDGMYTGYLSSCQQVDKVLRFAEDFKTADNWLLVDPAMGDNGRLYTGIQPELTEKMAQLCAKADVILPNITEACCLTGSPYRQQYDRQYIEALLHALRKICKGVCVLTGVSLEPGKTGIMGVDSTGESFYYSREKLPQSYHGTGDIFASVFAGGMLRGLCWQQAAVVAADFTALCIEKTAQTGRDDRFGVLFEKALPVLIEQLAEKENEK